MKDWLMRLLFPNVQERQGGGWNLSRSEMKEQKAKSIIIWAWLVSLWVFFSQLWWSEGIVSRTLEWLLSPTILALAASIASAFATVMLWRIEQADRQWEEIRVKRNTIHEFLCGRYDVSSNTFSRVLNVIPLVFEESPLVLERLAEFRKAAFEWNAQTNDTTDEGMILLDDLVWAMCGDIGIEYFESALPFAPTDVCMFKSRQRRKIE